MRAMGMLLHSLEKSEYLFEHQMHFSLLSQINVLEEQPWRMLYETYLVEEVLFNALAGRFLNMNANDFSYIRSVKSDEEIDARLARSWRRKEVYEVGREWRVTAKVPAASTYATRLLKYYPGTVFLIMVRRPESVLGSFLRKGWFSDFSLNAPIKTYPPYRRVGDMWIPWYVADESAEEFSRLSEVERGCAYFISAYSDIPQNPNILFVDYDAFVRAPHYVFDRICKKINGEPGPKTEELLSRIKEPVKDRSFDWNEVPPKTRDKIEAVIGAAKARAQTDFPDA